MSFKLPENAFGEFFAEAEEIIARISANLAQFESGAFSNSLKDSLIDSLYRDIHTLKGSAQLFGFQGIGLVGHALEACLEPVRSKRIPISEPLINQAYKGLDLIDSVIKDPDKDLKKDALFLKEIETFIAHLVETACQMFQADLPVTKKGLLLIDDMQSTKLFLDAQVPKHKEPNQAQTSPKTLTETTETLMTHAKSPSSSTSTSIAPSTSQQNSQSSSLSSTPAAKENQSESAEHGTSESSTIRVQIGLLDRLMNLVGEMVLIRNQVLQYNQKNDDYAFLNLSQRLDLVTSELQEDVMKTRMQPIGSVLNKFQRVVRDISKELNKQIEFTVKGAETELDKSLLESIKDPLTHIIRNSCDHGLENSEERRKAGKSDMGHVLVRAYHEGGQVVIEVSDDGRGLNLPKILNKAIEKKIVPAEKAHSLTEREISQLIFAPGFSTADQVSAISGRGVGMDVVKTNIEKAGGIVDLHSEMGKGTSIRLRIPLTLAIVPAMIVCSGHQTFAIPQVKLQELVRIDMEGDGPKIEFLQGPDF